MENKEVKISIPGEWVFQKVLGPTLEVIGSDLKLVYEKGKNQIINAAQKK